MSRIRMGPYTIEVSNEDKVFFPDSGITKGDLVEYYRTISEHMFPFVRERPLTMRRFPDGIQAEGFYQQQRPDYFPEWIQGARLERREGGSIEHVVCRNRSTLVYIANQGCITPHVWLSKVDKPEFPDRLIFDLDPPDNDFELVRETARVLRNVLDEVGLPAYLLSTGSRGVHVVVPLRRERGFDGVREFADRVSRVLVKRRPDLATLEHRKDRREGRIFMDTLRNAYGQHAVPPYAVRAKPGAPVAVPLDWDELDHMHMHAAKYTVENIFQRVDKKEDPWADFTQTAFSLNKPAARVDRLLD